MKLSEAIRAGAKIRPQAHGALYYTPWWAVLWPFAEARSCALGAAFEAGDCGSHVETATHDDSAFRGTIKAGQVQRVIETPSEWLALLRAEAICPQCEQCGPLKQIVPHLNDGHRWSREEIALFVARLEDASRTTSSGETMAVPDIE